MPGPDPQVRKHGRTPNTSADWREVDDVPFTGAPAMPKPPGRRKSWDPMVEAWWKTTSTMPHCSLWRAEDWQAVYELMFEKERYYRANDDDKTTAQLTEIRRREDALGIGDAARQKLRIRYKQKTEPGVAGAGPAGVREELEEGAPIAAVPGGKVVPMPTRRQAILRRSAAEAQAAAESDSQTG